MSDKLKHDDFIIMLDDAVLSAADTWGDGDLVRIDAMVGRGECACCAGPMVSLTLYKSGRMPS